MQKTVLIFILFTLSLFGFELKVASYNVENLFDLNHDKSEYKEYIPNTQSQWNQQTYTIKLNNTAKVIKELNADIIALQEIESKQALNDLLQRLPKYQYHSFTKNRNAAIGLAVLSQYPIIEESSIKLQSKVNRPIQKVTISIQERELIIYNNHWASKRNKESQRVAFALALQKELKQLPSNSDYILLGDFNSNYNEVDTLKYEKRLNNTKGLTGLNHVLNTTVKKQIITKQNIDKHKVISHYNLWYEIGNQERFSTKFRRQNHTPDNILLPRALFDNFNFSYINNSFSVFKPKYLYDNNKINRWKISKNRVHLQQGYSDHLPIMARFNLEKYKQIETKKSNDIKSLYSIEQVDKPISINNAIVLYKHKNHAIIKQPNGRAIFLYNCAESLEQGNIYRLRINEIKTYHGLKEVTKISSIQKMKTTKNYKKEFMNATTINLDDINFQNEIITNLQGTYKKGYLHYGEKKIKLYTKNKSALPKNGKNITIMSGHLGFYKHQAQIIIYKKSDIKVNF